MIAADPFAWHTNTVPELLLTGIEAFDDKPWTASVLTGTLVPN